MDSCSQRRANNEPIVADIGRRLYFFSRCFSCLCRQAIATCVVLYQIIIVRFYHIISTFCATGTAMSPTRASNLPQHLGCIYAINASSGNTLWHFNPNPQASFLAEPTIFFRLSEQVTISTFSTSSC